MAATFLQFDPDLLNNTHKFRKVPGSHMFDKVSYHQRYAASGTWGTEKFSKDAGKKHYKAGAYTVQNGFPTFYYKRPIIRSKREDVPAGKVPPNGNIMRVVGREEGDNGAPNGDFVNREGEPAFRQAPLGHNEALPGPFVYDHLPPKARTDSVIGPPLHPDAEVYHDTSITERRPFTGSRPAQHFYGDQGPADPVAGARHRRESGTFAADTFGYDEHPPNIRKFKKSKPNPPAETTSAPPPPIAPEHNVVAPDPRPIR